MQEKKQFTALTSLKGLFILVIAFHNTMLVKPLFESVPGSAFLRLYGGELGNSMFLLLSGFLMAYTYRDRIGSGRVSFPEYLKKRLLKLYPLFLVTNLVDLLVEVFMHGPSAVNLQKIAFTFLLQNGGGLSNASPYNTPTWFVSALLVCYAAFFLVCRYCRNSTQYRLSIAAGISWGYLLIGLKASVPFCYEANGVAFMNFFLGCALAELYPMTERNHKAWKPLAACVLLAVSLVLPLRYGVENICGDATVAFAFVICPLILYLALAKGFCSWILQWKGFVALGNISMSVFFWHLVVYDIFTLAVGYLMPGVLVREALYGVYAAVMLVWSLLSHRYLERHLLAKVTA